MKLDHAAKAAKLNDKRNNILRAVNILKSPSKFSFAGSRRNPGRYSIYSALDDKVEFADLTTLLQKFYDKALSVVNKEIEKL